ncbi:pro-sigmaK processing inhibitor BofA family protein [Ureibacillus aquaedulcis]|uniref:Pro-sigmaK processing inhibitor BofA family protein n=1 Tax=Ureibacillus aquaedulcis TaxID=3058421 RepID=A0ABT8GVJ9_9BACL|nr:pro-sigmaK processing inhibitor BofA family protein [Ureibacillus sp. BA0131]MDN4495443.1 pro-sigmaK processing inhibitor BofA family protein [Ureibacillus sp. BA0131]
MTTYIAIGVVCALLFFSILIGRKVGFGVIFEKLAILWFKLACSFALLYIAHIIVDGYDIVVPVNLFSALTITILGIPGVLCIGVLTVLQ